MGGDNYESNSDSRYQDNVSGGSYQMGESLSGQDQNSEETRMEHTHLESSTQQMLSEFDSPMEASISEDTVNVSPEEMDDQSGSEDDKDEESRVGSTVAIPNELLRPVMVKNGVSCELLLGRWSLTLELFGRVFIEDVGSEPGSIITQLGGFPVKEAKFRRDMEKIRNTNQRDLVLNKIERDRNLIISQSFKEFNSNYQSQVSF